VSRLFGTDGVRGIVGRDMTAAFASRLAFAAGQVLCQTSPHGAVLIGRDTRASGEMLEGAVAEGLCAAGIEVWLAGIITTPAVAFLTPDLGAAAGVVISASHNPHQYNGIKFFSSSGHKLPDEQLEEIERIFPSLADEIPAPSTRKGRVLCVPSAAERYVDYLISCGQRSGPSQRRSRLAGIRLILDCAHGAAFKIAAPLFRALGAEVKCIGISPDGKNINSACGSLHPARLQRTVLKEQASAGIAFDGDADRAIFVDEKGNLVDGDHVLAIMAREMKHRGRLAGNLVVGTTLSGLGLEISLRQAGCRLLRARVGDRYVLERMEKEGANLGGEPSGHVIFRDRATTGDGLLTGLELLGVMARKGLPLSELASVMQPLPQVMLNVPLRDNRAWQRDPGVSALIGEVEAELGGEGRLVVRPSGTEPVVRIMAEGSNREKISRAAQRIAIALTSRYGL